MRVEVRFFGSVERYTQQLPPEVRSTLPQVTLPDEATVDDLLRLLGVRLDRLRPFVSVNGYHQRDNVVLHDQDRVELVPPMAGGISKFLW